MQLRQFAGTHPVLTAVSCAGLQFLVTTLILKLGSVFAPASAFGQVKLLAFASTVILPLMLVQAFGLWRQVGLEFGKTRPGRFFLASMLLCVLRLLCVLHSILCAGPGLLLCTQHDLWRRVTLFYKMPHRLSVCSGRPCLNLSLLSCCGCCG